MEAQTTAFGESFAACAHSSGTGSAMAAISARPLCAIASMRLRPIQPTPKKPNLGVAPRRPFD